MRAYLCCATSTRRRRFTGFTGAIPLRTTRHIWFFSYRARRLVRRGTNFENLPPCFPFCSRNRRGPWGEMVRGRNEFPKTNFRREHDPPGNRVINTKCARARERESVLLLLFDIPTIRVPRKHRQKNTGRSHTYGALFF